MKAKVLFIGAICALSVYSCSPERDEQATENPTERAHAEKLELKKEKLNNQDQGSVNKIESDSIKLTPPLLSPQNGINPDTGIDPPNPDPNEGDDPKNVPPRK